MKKNLLICFLLLASTAATAKIRPQKFVNTKLKTDPNFQNAIVGLYAVDDNGRTIASWNAAAPMLTASTLKTVTTGLGMLILGPNYRFLTRIAYDGKIQKDTLYGNLYIIGGGDPTLGSKDTTLVAGVDSVFGIWKSAMDKLSIKHIDGNIIVDDSFFPREPMIDTWSWGDAGTYYGSAPSGLAFCENSQDIVLFPGEAPGDSVKAESNYPSLPGFKIINDLSTGPAGTGDQSMYYTSDLARTGHLTGTVASDKDSVLYDCSNKFPQISCGEEFRKYISANGITCKEKIIDICDTTTAPDEAKFCIAETKSPKLSDIIYVTNHISNNFFAETILRTIGKKETGSGSLDSSLVAVNRILDSLGIDRHGLKMADGCGLSRQNYVSPEFLCRFYTFMQKCSIFDAYINSLPSPGSRGTLKYVLYKSKPALKNRIHAKSGSLNGVKCYAGFVEKKQGKGYIKFAVFINNFSCSVSKIRPKLEDFMKSLAEAQN
ncbi:MAG: D-alanyl-D-alanine carboxypeptidase/D-alanyl-D-alanine-endopeptidase [Bacteroidales bacterium]|jgi:D-alanyl-D-alanine carboxypeptidase/D-alanyl-D-alanine-endopeptidase (penicillin-binding protein 4)|nr:D-alanyl-D-alanine carboxypeptidase/D-alanyl-D-alanine-endopeptidase [Bacteroidales bacterium]